ncbi:hypothetical protein [Desulfomonile tiedjei]|uniref:Uncharacterized protein n=1 Tax=Desulfomonile tiedjei (strain ATCC 49306 / DSM 6799 / DCB-1) TaxID=706587 RepID=I4C5W3_DESTA|nr:hypothetical protein [Desulfomonile tiedjei]AFM24954.1 hypothetical protein Desti_2264 [Desulfomonile tiedjei DSM 6799]
MKKLLVIFMLLAMLAPAPFAVARDASRDYLMHIWKQQQGDQKRWRAVMTAKTLAEREEAYKTYVYNLPRLWEPWP